MGDEMGAKVDVDEIIGVQTMLMAEPKVEPARDIMSVIETAQSAGFRAIEVVPAQFQPLTGNETISYLQTAYGRKERAELKDMLRSFNLVTVHGSKIIIDVTDGARGKELWEPYMQLMHLAHDIGAHIVTFHDLRRGPNWKSVAQEEMAHCHVEFGRIAAEYAEEWGILSGFELTENNLEFFFQHNIMDRIESRQFGLLIDIGHIAMGFADSANITGQVLEVIAEHLDQVVEFHAGGVVKMPGGLKEHRPLDENDLLDQAQIGRLLRDKEYENAIIFEIFYKSAEPEQVTASFRRNLEACLEGKKKIKEYWTRH